MPSRGTAPRAKGPSDKRKTLSLATCSCQRQHLCTTRGPAQPDDHGHLCRQKPPGLSCDQSDYKVCDTPLKSDEVAQVSPAARGVSSCVLLRHQRSNLIRGTCGNPARVRKQSRRVVWFSLSANLRSFPCSLNQAPCLRQANLKSFISKSFGTPMLMSGRAAPGMSGPPSAEGLTRADCSALPLALDLLWADCVCNLRAASSTLRLSSSMTYGSGLFF